MNIDIAKREYISHCCCNDGGRWKAFASLWHKVGNARSSVVLPMTRGISQFGELLGGVDH